MKGGGVKEKGQFQPRTLLFQMGHMPCLASGLSRTRGSNMDATVTQHALQNWGFSLSTAWTLAAKDTQLEPLATPFPGLGN